MEMYQKLSTQYYDLNHPHPAQDEINFYLSYIKNAEEPILEPMCGSGRFLIPFLEEGFDIDGVDASSAMIAICQKRAKTKGLKANLYKQFLDKLNLPRKYGITYIPAGSFGLITDIKKTNICLEKIYNHLFPGGKLILEIETPLARPKKIGVINIELREKNDGTKLLLTSFCDSYDHQNKIARFINRYELFENGHLINTELEDLNIRYFEKNDFKEILINNGFMNIKIYKTFANIQPDPMDPAVIFVAQRP